MARLCEYMIEFVLLGLLFVSGGFLYHGVAHGEAAGCANNMCKDIDYYYNCSALQGVALDNYDCMFCADTGRCVKPDDGYLCIEPVDSPVLKFALTTVNIQCDCAKAKGDKPTVEATGSYEGDYNNQFIRNVMNCIPTTSGSGI